MNHIHRRSSIVNKFSGLEQILVCNSGMQIVNSNNDLIT